MPFTEYHRAGKDRQTAERAAICAATDGFWPVRIVRRSFGTWVVQVDDEFGILGEIVRGNTT
jgi:hypothetical protein